MFSFRVSALSLESCDWRSCEPIFETSKALDKIYKLKERLNETKSKLDNIYKMESANIIMRSFDAFSIEKRKIGRKANAINVTNAWLKGYELFYTCNLIPVKSKIPEFVYFDNASFPGSFVLAANHLVHTWSKIEKFSWHASSLLDKTDENKEPLEDLYQLYKNYPERWLMNSHNNGDVFDENNIDDFQKQFKHLYGQEHSVDLYSCDLGTDASDNYNAQEEIHFLLNISQIVCGLTTLKGGGNMVFKHYTIFEPFTISYISLLANLFETVDIVKPITSKRTNSEIYIVCKKYLYPFQSMESSYIYYLFINRAVNKNTIPLVSSKYISKQIEDIGNAMVYIYDKQISALELFIKIATCDNTDKRVRYYKRVNNLNYIAKREFNRTIILPIDVGKNLNVIKKY